MPNHPRSAEIMNDNAEKALEQRLRSLARNMSAIGEGGGKPDELVEEIVKVAESLNLHITKLMEYGRSKNSSVVPWPTLNPRTSECLHPRSFEQLGRWKYRKKAQIPEFKLYRSQPSGPLLINDKARTRV